MKIRFLCFIASIFASFALIAPAALAAESPNTIKPPPGGGDYTLTVYCGAPVEVGGIPDSGYAYSAWGGGLGSNDRFELVTKVYRNGAYTGSHESEHLTASSWGNWSSNTFYGYLYGDSVTIHATVYDSYGTPLISGSGYCGGEA